MALNDKQSLAVNEIVGGSTVTEAAEKAGVTRQTVHEWLANPGVRRELDERRSRRDREVVESLLAQGTKVTSNLSKLLDDPSPAVRLRASELWLKISGISDKRWLSPALTKEELEIRERETLERDIRTELEAEFGKPKGLFDDMEIVSEDEKRFQAEFKRRLATRSNGKQFAKKV